MRSLFLIEHLCLSGVCQGLYLGHVCTKAIGPWLLRILEFSLIEGVVGPTSGLHEGSHGLQPLDIFIGWNIYVESHMASMDKVGHDCRGVFRDKL